MNIIFTNAILDEFKLPGYHRAKHCHDHACERLGEDIFQQLVAGIPPENMTCCGTYCYAYLSKKAHPAGFCMQIMYPQAPYRLILRHAHAMYVQYSDGKIAFFNPDIFVCGPISIYMAGQEGKKEVTKIVYRTQAAQYNDVVTYYPTANLGQFRRVGPQGEVILAFTPAETCLQSATSPDLCPQLNSIAETWQLQPIPTYDILYSFLMSAVQQCNECFQLALRQKK